MQTRSLKHWLSLSAKLGHPKEMQHEIMYHLDDRLTEVESNQANQKQIPWMDFFIQGASFIGALNADKINNLFRLLGL